MHTILNTFSKLSPYNALTSGEPAAYEGSMAKLLGPQYPGGRRGLSLLSVLRAARMLQMLALTYRASQDANLWKSCISGNVEHPYPLKGSPNASFVE